MSAENPSRTIRALWGELPPEALTPVERATLDSFVWACRRGCLVCEREDIGAVGAFTPAEPWTPDMKPGDWLPYALCRAHAEEIEDPDSSEGIEALLRAAVALEGGVRVSD